MNGAQLIEITLQMLGDVSRTFYPSSLVMRHVNYAQNLMATLPVYTIYGREAVTLAAGECFIELRNTFPRYLTLRRVILGDVRSQEETRQFGQVRRLRKASLDVMAARRQWIAAQGIPARYFTVGRTLLGVHPRPITSTIVTLTATVLPGQYTSDTLGAECSLQVAAHPFVAEVAAGLLLLREGMVEGQKGLMMLARVLPAEWLNGIGKALGGLRQMAQTEG